MAKSCDFAVWEEDNWLKAHHCSVSKEEIIKQILCGTLKIFSNAEEYRCV